MYIKSFSYIYIVAGLETNQTNHYVMVFLAKKHLETDEHSRLNFVLTFLRYQDLIPRANIVI